MFVSIILSVFFSYIPGISKVVFGGDSGDITVVSWFGGVAHPQGYPLNTMIGWVFTHLPYDATVAYKANLMAAFLQAASVGLVFLMVRLLTTNTIISLTTALVLAFTPLFWLYAHTAEVFQLTLLFLSLHCYFLLLAFKSSNNKKRFYTKISILFLGLGFFHQYTTALVFPAALYLLIKMKSRIFTRNIGYLHVFWGFFIGLLPYLFIVYSSLKGNIINWLGPFNLLNLLKLITRSDYGMFSDFQSTEKLSPFTKIIQLGWYIKVLKSDFGVLGLILAFLGFIYLFKKSRDLFWYFLLAFFFTGPFFILYITFPPFSIFIQGVIERFLLLNYLFITIYIGFGIFVLFTFLRRFYFIKKEIYSLLLVGLLLLIPFSMYISNYHKTDLSRYTIGSDLSQDILNSAKLPGIIFLQGDTIVFNTQYSHYIDNINAESKLVMTGRLRRPNYRQEFAKNNKDLSFPENFFENKVIEINLIIPDLIKLNFDNYPIYSVVQIEPLPNGYGWVRQGMLNRLYKKGGEPKNSELLTKINSEFKNLKYDSSSQGQVYQQFFGEHVEGFYAASFASIGATLLERGMLDESQKFYNLSLETNPSSAIAYIGLGEVFKKRNDCKAAEEMYAKSLEVDKSVKIGIERLAYLYKDCFKDQGKAEFYFTQLKQLQQDNADTPVDQL
ncbi:MAG: hypothetical protein UR98_C0003G0071 [Parcubacteria group bacterium GW2011_GWA1_36_12]|nr:MAG: hypothetical protein UR98_C0003G0071 [Parcubacteria group bacterium GW2011_GWA1_36_12]